MLMSKSTGWCVIKDDLLDLTLPLSNDVQHIDENVTLQSCKSFCLPEARPLCRDDSGREHFPPPT